MVTQARVVRERIAQHIGYTPRNKVIFAPALPAPLQTTDVGYRLADLIKDDLTSPHLPSIAGDALNSLMKKAMHHDEIIGDYVAITNWGILFEPSLKLDVTALIDSLSKNNTLILVNSGYADNDIFHLGKRPSHVTLSIGNFHPYILA